MTSLATTLQSQSRQSWGAVLALSLAAFALVASEFMPVSLLTPVAADLNISEGRAGQAIAISGAFALLTALFISSISSGVNRKTLLLSLTLLMMISGCVVAFAPTYSVFMVGRALIGAAIGGFWSLSAATAMRLVPRSDVPRALALVNGGNALATVIAAPAGSFLGDIVGWRWAFFCVVPIAAVAFAWKWIGLPSMADEARPAGGVRRLLRLQPRVAAGMTAVSVFFMGQFALFTYLRPFLETVTQFSTSALSLTLLLIGVCGFIGTIAIGRFLEAHLYRTLIVIPIVMAIIAAALILFGGSTIATVTLLGLWGLLGTAAPVGWWTWLAKTLPSDAELGGGLMVAVIQLAIMLGATVGGVLFDASGYASTFGVSAALLLVAALLAVATSQLSAHSIRASS
jgi:predicted MFS family arabinose efflux permease